MKIRELPEEFPICSLLEQKHFPELEMKWFKTALAYHLK